MNTEVLREAAVLEYNAASSGEQTSYNFDYLFMENCIQAGYTMDEAIDAALQKFKLYMSQEAKLCSRIGKEIKANVKKKNYPEAIALAKKRLAHLENLLKRADEEIDDDEEFIISMEAMAKSIIITMIVSAILVKVAEGIVPGSGWLIDAIKKGVSKLKIKLGKDGSFIRDMVDPILTIAGISKQVSNPIVSHKIKKWQKNRNGDINREFNEGRPDMTTMSISRTQAKTRFKKLIQAQKDEIKMLEEAQRLHNRPKPKNESVELLTEGFSHNDKIELGVAFGLIATALVFKGIPEARRKILENKRKKAEEMRSKSLHKESVAKGLKDAMLIAQGKLKGEAAVNSSANFDLLKYVGCPADKAADYINALIAADSDKALTDMDDSYKSFYTWHNDRRYDAKSSADVCDILDKYENDPKYVFYADAAYELLFYDAKTKKVHEVLGDEGKEIIYDFSEIYRKYKIPTSIYNEIKAAASNASNESVELDEGFFRFGGKAKRDDKYSSLASAAQKAYNKKFIGSDEFISEARKRCPIPKGDYTNDDQILDVLAKSMSKAVKLPSFAKLIKSHNEAIKEYEALDKAKFNSSDSYIVKVSDFAIDNDGEYINFSSSNQFVNSMFAETFEKLANALLSDAGIKRHVSTGDGDEGAVYLDESVGLDEGLFDFFRKKKSSSSKKYVSKEDAMHAEFMKWYNSLPDKNKEAFYNEMMKIAARLVKQQLAANKHGGTGFSVHELDDDLEEDPKTMKYIYAFEYDIYDFFNNANINYRDDVQTNDFWEAQSELVKKFKAAGIELDCGGDWDDGPFYIISVSDAIKRKFTPKTTSASDKLNEAASLDSSTKSALASFGFSALLFAGALGVKHMSRKRREALERKIKKEQADKRAKEKAEAETLGLRSALMVAKGEYTVPALADIDKLKCAGCSAENAEKYLQKILDKGGESREILDRFIDDAESNDYPDEDMIAAIKKHMDNPIYVIDVEGTYSITFYDAKTGKVHIVTFGKDEETVDFKAMYDKYVVPVDLRRYYIKRINEIKVKDRRAIKENVDIIVEASILLNSGFRGTREEVLQEAKLKTSARNMLPDSDFGLPEDRKFPLNDAAHVKAAIKMFSHCPDEKKAKLAKRIVTAMGKYGIDTKFSKDSPMYNYVSAKYKAD